MLQRLSDVKQTLAIASVMNAGVGGGSAVDTRRASIDGGGSPAVGSESDPS